jgi:uncharacterized protein
LVKEITIKLIHLDTERVILEELYLANTFWTRLKGLLGKSHLKPNTGLAIWPCQSIHMLGMKFSIDAIFVDRSGKICAMYPDFSPGQLSNKHNLRVWAQTRR